MAESGYQSLAIVLMFTIVGSAVISLSHNVNYLSAKRICDLDFLPDEVMNGCERDLKGHITPTGIVVEGLPSMTKDESVAIYVFAIVMCTAFSWWLAVASVLVTMYIHKDKETPNVFWLAYMFAAASCFGLTKNLEFNCKLTIQCIHTVCFQDSIIFEETKPNAILRFHVTATDGTNHVSVNGTKLEFEHRISPIRNLFTKVSGVIDTYRRYGLPTGKIMLEEFLRCFSFCKIKFYRLSLFHLLWDNL